jgi:hypothetical protein
MINDKMPTYDDEAERATFGALMLDNNTVGTAQDEKGKKKNGCIRNRKTIKTS